MRPVTPRLKPESAAGGVSPGAVNHACDRPATEATRYAPRQASPLGGGMPSMPGMGGGGGMGSGGMPSMPGGLGSGGMSGLSSNPLTGGLGGMPSAAGGLPTAGGVPASAGAGSPAAAFSRGLSTGAGIGGGMPAMPPTAPASPSPALSPGGACCACGRGWRRRRSGGRPAGHGCPGGSSGPCRGWNG